MNKRKPEELSALRTEAYFAERSARADLKKAERVLAKAGKGQPPMEGDELPASTRTTRAK